MSPCWLFLIIPISVIFGFGLSGLCKGSSQADKCAECQYNCKICPKNKKETN